MIQVRGDHRPRSDSQSAVALMPSPVGDGASHAELIVEVASAQTGNRHVAVAAAHRARHALSGASPDRTTSIRLPVGQRSRMSRCALEASATGWSQWLPMIDITDARYGWTSTSGPSVDTHSDDLRWQVDPSAVFLTHGEGSGGEGSTAYLHTGTSSLRQAHT